MEGFITFVLGVFFLYSLLCIVKPKLLSSVLKTNLNRYHAIGVSAVLLILFLVGMANFTPSKPTSADSASVAQGSGPMTTADCYKLGSNYRTELCLDDVQKEQMANEPSFTDLQDLQMSNSQMSGNTYNVPNPSFSATIHNNSPRAVKDILVRFQFFKSDTVTNCSQNTLAEDTQYAIVANTLFSGDSYKVNQIIQTNFDTSGQFRWCAQIVAAHEYY